MSDPAPNAELLGALGRLVRGLSALFWGLPIALVVCVQTSKGDWFQALGIVPALAVTALLWYGLALLGSFQKQERVWHQALDRAKIFAIVNIGLSPFLYWWNRMPLHPFYTAMVDLMTVTGLLFLFTLNPVLWRLSAMLPDETLRAETRLFTRFNRWVLALTLGIVLGYFLLARVHDLPGMVNYWRELIERGGIWLGLPLVLLPVAMTMALLWKIKEVILASVFGEH